MSVVAPPPAGRTQRRVEGLFLLAARARAAGRRMMRRLMRKPRTVAESPNLLPTLIKVFAAFARVEGEVLEEEIDSSLGFLRYDYPEAVYSELRKLFRQALNEHQDLNAMAQKLSANLDDRAQDDAGRAALRSHLEGRPGASSRS